MVVFLNISSSTIAGQFVEYCELLVLFAHPPGKERKREYGHPYVLTSQYLSMDDFYLGTSQ